MVAALNASKVSGNGHNLSTPQRSPNARWPSHPLNTKVLLLEGVNQCAVQAFESLGCQVEYIAGALNEEALMAKIHDVHVIGIRSKTRLSKKVLDHAKHLCAIGCFCIATEQVDLEAAASHSIAVFNSPFSNSRSVAELVIGEIIALARQLGDRNQEMHQGTWNKVSSGCHEIRGKVLGIVGYGHVGSQLSVLAEILGMTVYFYDIAPQLPLGTARPLGSLKALLRVSDFVSLHVPETAATRNMMGDYEIMECMKKGACLINNARASLVQIPALIRGLQSGHLAGAALDVFPNQPIENGPYFTGYTDLAMCPNVIMTPHIGGATEEAQEKIGREVSSRLIQYMTQGIKANTHHIPKIEPQVTCEDSHVLPVLHESMATALKVCATTRPITTSTCHSLPHA